MELHLVEETTLKGLVEITRQVGGGNEDAVEVFNLLQDNVLHGVVHLINRVLYVLSTLVDDGIGLVEEQNGHHLAVLTQPAIAGKHLLDVLLALTNPLIAQSGDVHLHKVTSRLTGYLKDSLGLACTRSTIEQASKALAHTLFFESLLDRWQGLGAKQIGKTVYLLLLRGIEEQRFLLDGRVSLQKAVIGSHPSAL